MPGLCPTLGKSLQALGKWKRPPVLGNPASPSLQAPLLCDSLAPMQEDLVREDSASEWSGLHRVGRTGAGPPLDYTWTPPSYLLTSMGHHGTHPTYRSGPARTGWTPSPQGTVNPEPLLARLVDNLAHTLGGLLLPLARPQTQAFMGFPKVPCQISLLKTLQAGCFHCSWPGKLLLHGVPVFLTPGCSPCLMKGFSLGSPWSSAGPHSGDPLAQTRWTPQ